MREHEHDAEIEAREQASREQLQHERAYWKKEAEALERQVDRLQRGNTIESDYITTRELELLHQRDEWKARAEEAETKISTFIGEELSGPHPDAVRADTWKARAEEAERDLERARRIAVVQCAHLKVRTERLAEAAQALLSTKPGKWKVEVDGELFHDLGIAIVVALADTTHEKESNT